MPLKFDDNFLNTDATNDDSIKSQGVSTPNASVSWLTIPAFLVSAATLLESLIITNGILPDEKGLLIGLIVFGFILSIFAIATSIKRRNSTGTTFSIMSIIFLLLAIIFTSKAWR